MNFPAKNRFRSVAMSSARPVVLTSCLLIWSRAPPDPGGPADAGQAAITAQDEIHTKPRARRRPRRPRRLREARGGTAEPTARDRGDDRVQPDRGLHADPQPRLDKAQLGL